MPSSRRAILASLVAAVALTALTPFVAEAGEPTPARLDAEAEVLALVFTADWCAACKVLAPELRAARESLDGLPVTFVTLDQTDADARSRSAAMARAGSYSSVYSEHEGRTGFVLLLHAETKEVLDRITLLDSESEIREKVRRAVASS